MYLELLSFLFRGVEEKLDVRSFTMYFEIYYFLSLRTMIVSKTITLLLHVSCCSGTAATMLKL